MPPAKLVGGLAHEGVGGLAVVILLSIHKGDGVQHKMVVDVLTVQGGWLPPLETCPPQSPGQFYANLMGLLQRDLSGSEGLVAMVGDNPVLFAVLLFHHLHFIPSNLRGAVLIKAEGEIKNEKRNSSKLQKSKSSLYIMWSRI